MTKNQDLKNSLLEELITGADIQKMLDISEKILETPIALNDLSISILMYSKNYPTDDLEDRINIRKSTLKKDRESSVAKARKIINSGEPMIVNWPYVRRNQLVCGGIVNDHLASFVTIPQESKPLGEIDFSLVKFIAKILSTAMILNRTNSFKDYLTSDHNLLWGILIGKYCTEERRPELYWNAFENISSYRILWYLPIDENKNILSNKTIDCISSQLKYCWQIPYDDGFVIMIDGNDAFGLKELDKLCKKVGLLIGASDTFNNLKDTINNFKIAQNVLNYAKKSSKTSGVALFDDYKLYHILNYAKNNMDIKKLQNGKLEEIINYDKENNTEYSHTLGTYLYSNLNLQETAIKLCIHKNTVSYRISKLSDLFNIDLNNIQTITSLYCSLLIKDMILD